MYKHRHALIHSTPNVHTLQFFPNTDVFMAYGSHRANIKIHVKNGYCNSKWTMEANGKKICTKPMEMLARKRATGWPTTDIRSYEKFLVLLSCCKTIVDKPHFVKLRRMFSVKKLQHPKWDFICMQSNKSFQPPINLMHIQPHGEYDGDDIYGFDSRNGLIHTHIYSYHIHFWFMIIILIRVRIAHKYKIYGIMTTLLKSQPSNKMRVDEAKKCEKQTEVVGKT